MIWHEFLCKTNFSFLIGASHPQEIITSAHDLGYHSLCVNDFDGVYGLARCYRAMQKLKKDGKLRSDFRLNYGAEIHLSKDHDAPILLQTSLTLVVHDHRGYYNLCKILSLAHQDGKHYAHISPEILLRQELSGISAILPMRGAIRYYSQKLLLNFWQPIVNAFSGRFYVAISRHLHHSEDHWIKASIALADALNTKVIFSQDIFFHHPDAKPLSDLLHSIRTNKSFHDAQEHFFPNAERSMQSLSELKRRYGSFSFFAKALANAAELAQSLEFDLKCLRYQYPQRMLPQGYDANAYLTKLSYEGIAKRFAQNNSYSEKVLTSIKRELQLITSMQFADYFLTVWDIVAWARSQGILCQGRGSAANSSVCYALGITEVDPSVFDLLFERFISKERGDPPDIDVDFEHERREEVVQYIYKRYGREQAAMVANVITFRGKGALRAVGKALGFSEARLKSLSRISESKHLRTLSLAGRLSELIKDDPDAEEIPDEILQSWAKLAEKLRGFPRHLGIHSGGFMLSDLPLNWLVPQEPATMPGRTVIQWSKDDIEALGFFKIDILALGMLTAITKAFSYLKENRSLHLSMSGICRTQDQATYLMIQKADTVGTFQIESRAQMSMLPRLKPKCFYDLVIEIAIIRPGPIQGGVIHPYLRRREGKEPITYPDKRLIPILEKTLGIPIFQEQAMRIAVAVGDFTPGEADELRRHIGAWNIRDFDHELSPLLEKLAKGMAKNAIEPIFAEQILGQMRGFSDYGFPESHSISFALIAYVSCYLKRHYPAEFFTALLNSQPMGFYSPHSLLQAAKRDGVKVQSISIVHSFWEHKLEKTDEVYAIRLGFCLVFGLCKESALKLVKSRRAWKDAKEFFAEVNIPKPDLCSLAAADAFADFGLSRSEALWQAQAAPFCRIIDALVEEDDDIAWEKECPKARLDRDFAAFSTSLGEHPSVVIRKYHWRYPIEQKHLRLSKELAEMKDGKVLAFGMILFRQAPPSAKGMVFLTLEDHLGFINLVFKPQVYQKFGNIIESQGFLLVKGLLQKSGNSHSILVNQVIEPFGLGR